MRLTVLAIAVLLFAIATLIVRTQRLSNVVALVVAVASPYAAFATLIALALLIACRRVWLSIMACGIVVLTLAVQARWYYSGHPPLPGPSTDIRVLSLNLRKGQADATALVALAKARADVVAVSELTPDEARYLERAGINDTFPFSLLKPKPGAAGIGMWSRFPLSTVSPATGRHTAVSAARMQVPGVRLDPLVVSLHITSPVTAEAGSFRRWRDGIEDTKQGLDELAQTAGPGAVIVAGDFNSTPDMRQFRDLLTNGYRDAVEQTGAGFAPTFPSNTLLPPVLLIDHVLTRNAAASSIRTIDIPGSDHRALVATIKVPVDRTAS